MPVTLSFDIQGASPNQRNRLQSMFERFGWQNLGGSSYRYPTLGETPFAVAPPRLVEADIYVDAFRPWRYSFRRYPAAG